MNGKRSAILVWMLAFIMVSSLVGQEVESTGDQSLRPLDYKTGIGFYASGSHFLWGD